MPRISSITQFSARCEQSTVPKNERRYIKVSQILVALALGEEKSKFSKGRRVDFSAKISSGQHRRGRVYLPPPLSAGFDSHRASRLVSVPRPLFPAAPRYFSASPPHISYLVLSLSLSLLLLHLANARHQIITVPPSACSGERRSRLRFSYTHRRDNPAYNPRGIYISVE